MGKRHLGDMMLVPLLSLTSDTQQTDVVSILPDHFVVLQLQKKPAMFPLNYVATRLGTQKDHALHKILYDNKK